jgi:outer membrane immunogenic protein
MKSLISAGVIAATLAAVSTSFAADIAKPVYKAPPVVVPVYNWTGFYIGGNAGYAWSDVNTSWLNISNPAADTAAAIAARQLVGTNSYGLDGFTGGFQAGINWQVGAWVFGIEGDINYFKQSAGIVGVPLPGLVAANTLSQAVELHNLYTVRGRIGYAWDRTLLYFTGGWAASNIDVADSSTYPASFMGTTGSKLLSGWTVGGGIEWALGNNWSVKAEYLYADLGDYQTVACNSAVTSHCYSFNHDATIQVVRAGLNYKFDWSKSPVVARY